MDFVYFVGRFHVLVLHLPIGIILITLLLEWLARKPKYRHLGPAAGYLWVVAAVSAIVTAALGYMHFAEGGFSGPSANAHRLYGTSVAVVTTLIWLLRFWRPLIYKKVQTVAGLVLLVLLILTGHYGGNLTHGDSFLVQFAPGPIRSLLGAAPARPAVTDLAKADPYLDVVQPLLQARCSRCHGDEKQEADLKLTTHAAILKGSESGPVIARGDAEMSELYRRITLPEDAEDFMPAEGKTPLTDAQVVILRWWIDAGAPIDVTLGELNLGADVTPLLAAELGLGPSSDEGERAALPLSADPQLVEKLYQAGFLVRQVSLADPMLVVSVYAPGKPIGAEQLAALMSAAEHVTELDLQSSGIDDNDLNGLQVFTELTRLRLDNNDVTDAGVGILAGLPRLSYLNLYGNSAVSDASVDALSGMTQLQRIYLWQTSVSEAGAERLRQQRPNLGVELATTAGKN